MVHLRLNEKETNPNPHINFITALKSSPDEEEDARQLLRALAAQVKPVMKAHGFSVNSFEEVQQSLTNNVYIKCRWLNFCSTSIIEYLQGGTGTTARLWVWWKRMHVPGTSAKYSFRSFSELVLRRPDGSFYPTYWLMSTLCHEVRCCFMLRRDEFLIMWSSSWLISRCVTGLSSYCQQKLKLYQHMNHGRDFQALWSRLRVEVRQLQDRGYYGDGTLIFIAT